jgi:Tubulin-tyrosine ligase family
MNGLKFDLRIYVLILNLYPLEIFLYDEGLARFATVNYKAPSTENLHQTYMHLTNYSLNKRSVNYKHSVNDQQLDGSKRKLSLVWQQLSEMFGPTKIERSKVLIVEMINKTLLAIVPELRVEYEFELPLAKQQNLSCFQVRRIQDIRNVCVDSLSIRRLLALISFLMNI